MMQRTAEASPHLKARIAGVFYSITFITGVIGLVSVNGRFVASLIAIACYIAVALLFYDLFKPVSRSLSLLAAFVSLMGCVTGALGLFRLATAYISPMVFFGFYCVLIGYLIFKSTFLPRALGALMAFGGLSWLTFLSRPLAHYLSPYNFVPGLLGEGALTVWLLAVGVNVPRWEARAKAMHS
jgi:hypothetical protein